MPYLKEPTDILSLEIIHMDEEFTGWTEYHGAQGELKVAKQVTPDQVIWWKPVNYRGTVRRIRTAEPAQKEE